MTNSPYHPISVVIIGLNVEKHIKDCISSVFAADYPNELLEIIYVDGGSSDLSVSIARSFHDANVLELKSPHPTPGKGRNAGYRAANHQFIQFLDADTVVHPDWFKISMPHLTSKNGAVKGKTIEKYPRKNNYHLIGDIEWNVTSGRGGLTYSEGPCQTFGGNVLIRKDVLAEIDGYDEALVVGEDPDISYRVRQAGWTIYQLDTEMVSHDLNMNTFCQYLKRGYRSGYAYAQIGLRYITHEEKYFLYPLSRIFLSTTLPFCIIILSLFLNMGIIGAILASYLIFRPLMKIMLLKNSIKLSVPHAFLYGTHLSFIRFVQLLGILRYLLACLSGMPIRNKGYKVSA